MLSLVEKIFLENQPVNEVFHIQKAAVQCLVQSNNHTPVPAPVLMARVGCPYLSGAALWYVNDRA